jgi:hypothetical protein
MREVAQAIGRSPEHRRFLATWNRILRRLARQQSRRRDA